MATVTKTTEEARIRAMLEDWAGAMRARDVEGVMAAYAPEIVIFDCHSQLQITGATAYRAFLEGCFPCMQGTMTFDLHELEIDADGELGFCRFIAHCIATDLQGGEHTSWLRSTLGLRKTNGQWRIAHAHVSAPFNPMNGQAMLDASPAGMSA